MFKKPAKKTDLELFTLIEQKIKQREYVFLNHARQRQLERNISDLDVLNILEGKQGYDRTSTRLYEKLTLPNPRGSDRGVHDGAYLSKSIEFLDFDKYDRCHHGPRGQATGIRKKVIKSRRKGVKN